MAYGDGAVSRQDGNLKACRSDRAASAQACGWAWLLRSGSGAEDGLSPASAGCVRGGVSCSGAEIDRRRGYWRVLLCEASYRSSRVELKRIGLELISAL